MKLDRLKDSSNYNWMLPVEERTESRHHYHFTMLLNAIDRMCNVTRYRRGWDPCSFAKWHNIESGNTNLRVAGIHLFNIPSFTVALVKKNDRWFIVLPKCDPFKEDLCLVTEAYNAEKLALLCIRQVLIRGLTRQFALVCPISCRETGRQNQFISFVGSHPKDDLMIRCEEDQYNLNINPNLGVLLIEVPCHCQFEDGNSTDVYPTFPCVDKTIKFGLQTVLPAIWTKTPGLTIPSWDKTMPQFGNLDDCLKEKWINTNSENQSTHTITYYIIANFTLSILTYVYLYCKTQRKFLYYTDRKIKPSHKKSVRFRSLKLSGPTKTFKIAQQRSLPNISKENEYLDPKEINPRLETLRVPPNSSSRSRPAQFESSATSDTKTI
ncbi:hypothetical protein FQA39_LY13422 [Lamprigera yunnana]|nr:hypothetical protein FQA39_LY13422 [Lamprigera yunnana]